MVKYGKFLKNYFTKIQVFIIQTDYYFFPFFSLSYFPAKEKKLGILNVSVKHVMERKGREKLSFLRLKFLKFSTRLKSDMNSLIFLYNLLKRNGKFWHLLFIAMK